MQSREKKTDSISNLSVRFKSTASNMHRLFWNEKESMDHSFAQDGMWFFALLPLGISLLELLVPKNNQDAFSAMYNTTHIESIDNAKVAITMMAFFSMLILFITCKEIDAERDKTRHQFFDGLSLLKWYHKAEVENLQNKNKRTQDELTQLSSSYQNAMRLWLLEKFSLVYKIVELLQNQQKPVRRLR